MNNRKQNDSPQSGKEEQEKLGKKPIGLEGGQTGGQINGPVGSLLPDKHPDLQDVKKPA